MLDRRGTAQLELPTGLLQPPAEVGVLGGPNALVEAADLLERGTPDEQVGRHRAGPVGMAQVRLLGEEVAGRAVASGERVAVDQRHYLARERADVLRHRRREVGVEQTSRRQAVGVEEQDPLAVRARRSDVAGVGRRALAGGPDHRHAAPGGCEAGVVGEDQLVSDPQVEREQRVDRGAGPRTRPRRTALRR